MHIEQTGVNRWLRPKTLGLMGLWLIWSITVFAFWAMDSPDTDAQEQVVSIQPTQPADLSLNDPKTEEWIPAEVPKEDANDAVVTSIIPEETSPEIPTLAISEEPATAPYLLKIDFDEGTSILSKGQNIESELIRLQQEAKKEGYKLLIEAYDSADKSNQESIDLSKRRAWRIRSMFTNTHFRRKSVDWTYHGQKVPQHVKDKSTYLPKPIVYIKKIESDVN